MSDVFATEEYAVSGDSQNASPVPPVTGGHVYDLEMNQTLDEVTLTEDGADKTTLPFVATFVGTRTEWNNLSAAEQEEYRVVHFTDDGGFGDISDNQVAFTSEDCSDANASTWISVTPLETGLSLRTLFNRVSQMFKNVRYLKKSFANMDAVIQDSKNSSGVIAIPCPIIWDGNTSRNNLVYFTDFYLLSRYDINVQQVSIQGVANYQPSQFTPARHGNLIRVTFNTVTTNYGGRLGYIYFSLTPKT